MGVWKGKKDVIWLIPYGKEICLTVQRYSFFFLFFFWATNKKQTLPQTPQISSIKYKLLKKLLRTMFTSGNVQRKHVNTVHRPEEEHKEEFALFHRKCLLKANGVCDAWLLVVTQGPVLSRLYCQPVLVKMVKVKYSLQHSNKAGLAAEMEGKECFFSFFFSFFV